MRVFSGGLSDFRRLKTSEVWFRAKRRTRFRPQLSSRSAMSSLAKRPFSFGALLLAAVEFAQAVRLWHVLHNLSFQPSPELSVQCLGHFQVRQRFSSCP
jgi:hypothetical protein